jgi:hypothetical protein
MIIFPYVTETSLNNPKTSLPVVNIMYIDSFYISVGYEFLLLGLVFFVYLTTLH